MTGEAPDRLETIAWVYSQPELAVLLSLLEYESIRVVPIGRGHASVDFPLTVALGGIEIRVHAEDAADARSLLAGIDRTPLRGGFLLKDRLVDLLLVLVLLGTGLLAPPARIPAFFVVEGRTAASRAD